VDEEQFAMGPTLKMILDNFINPGFQRIEVNVGFQLLKVSILLANDRFVAVLEKMTDSLMTSVEILRIF
jgi:hypothetical protein